MKNEFDINFKKRKGFLKCTLKKKRKAIGLPPHKMYI